jgi:hypothetical protein
VDLRLVPLSVLCKENNPPVLVVRKSREDIMVSELDDLDMVSNVEAIVGTYADEGKYTFDCEDGKYRKDPEGTDTYLAVKYADVENSAQPATMVDAKWIQRSKWNLLWAGADGTKAEGKGVLHVENRGGWALLKITQEKKITRG